MSAPVHSSSEPTAFLPNVPCSLPHAAVLPDAVSNARWFEEEVHAHESDLRNYVRGSFPRVRDVDDVVQESYLRVWKAKAAGHIDCARGFLFRIARNVAVDLVRRSGYRTSEEVGDRDALSVVDDKASPGDQVAAREKLDILAAAIDSLPPRCREIVILTRLQEKSYRETAQLLGLSEKTVAEQLQRAARKLGKELAARGMESST